MKKEMEEAAKKIVTIKKIRRMRTKGMSTRNISLGLSLSGSNIVKIKKKAESSRKLI